MIASIIDSYVTRREEFQLVSGYQPFDSLFYVMEGSFLCDFGAGEELISKGDVAIFNSRSRMTRHVLESVTFLYVKFSQKHSSSIVLESRAIKNIDSRGIEDALRLIELSNERSKTSLALREHYLNDLLLCTVGEPSLRADRAEPVGFSTVLDRALDYMRENLENKINLGDVARASGMSQSLLENKFRELFGVSTYAYLIGLRMERARGLLAETTLPVCDICTRCGYENLFYFCNAFKKNTGMTPTEYRKSK